MRGWDLLVDRGDLTKTSLVETDPQVPLAEGEALLAVESFALTANNVTYGAVGDQIGYWKFFPAPEGQGRIPVWGFARVVRSNAPDAPEGLRLFGYWPMSSHTVRGCRSVHPDTWRSRPTAPSCRPPTTPIRSPSRRRTTTGARCCGRC